MIVLYDDVKKADARIQALEKLRSFLNEKEPRLIQFLQRLWGNQQRAITYKEIREAILRGDLTAEQVKLFSLRLVIFRFSIRRRVRHK